jgi:hypothetical protein
MTTPPSLTTPTPPGPFARLLGALEIGKPGGWRETAYAPEIDAVLAQKALDAAQPEVADRAARVIGRIRSGHAVRALAEKQRAGDRRALHALALVRDEAPSLPATVAPNARLFAWLVNTQRRLSAHGLTAMWRFLLASLGGLLAMVYYVVRAFTGPGAALILSQIWGNAISYGLTFGVLTGLTVYFAGELPDRLRGFWRLWARVPLAAALGFGFTTVTWALFNYLILNIEVIDWPIMASAGIGPAIGWALIALARWPGLVRAAITAVAMYVPLAVSFHHYWTVGTPAVLYFAAYEHVFEYLIPMVALVGVFSHIQAIVGDVRGLLKRRKTQAPAAATG